MKEAAHSNITLLFYGTFWLYWYPDYLALSQNENREY